jgi:hypothetical protein
LDQMIHLRSTAIYCRRRCSPWPHRTPVARRRHYHARGRRARKREGPALAGPSAIRAAPGNLRYQPENLHGWSVALPSPSELGPCERVIQPLVVVARGTAAARKRQRGVAARRRASRREGASWSRKPRGRAVAAVTGRRERGEATTGGWSALDWAQREPPRSRRTQRRHQCRPRRGLGRAKAQWPPSRWL